MLECHVAKRGKPTYLLLFRVLEELAHIVASEDASLRFAVNILRKFSENLAGTYGNNVEDTHCEETAESWYEDERRGEVGEIRLGRGVPMAL